MPEATLTMPVEFASAETGLALAKQTARRGDIDTAVAICRQLITEFPCFPDAYSEAAANLRRAHRYEEAETLLNAVLTRFHDIPQIWIEYALISTNQRQWAAAVERWQITRERFPNCAEGYGFGLLALRESKQCDAAEELAASALQRLPKDARLLREYGLIARQRGDLPEAIRRFTMLREHFPNRDEGYEFGIILLRESNQYDAAEELAALALNRFPKAARILVEYGLIARQRGDLPEAIRRFAMLRERFPDNPEGFAEAAMTMGQGGKGEDAAILLSVAIDRFPNDPAVAIAYAWNASFLADWSETLRRCTILREQFPDRPQGYFIAVGALLRLGHFDEAELLAARGRERFSHDLELMVWSAKTATHRRDWTVALPRWELAFKAAPNSRMVLDGMAIARNSMDLDLADHRGHVIDRRVDVTHPSSELVADLSDARLMVCFEGLGDNCEFGLVQRLNGVEPLGLLRWANPNVRNLIAMLRTRFEGVGLPENTTVTMLPSGEWIAIDRRYFGMHTFINDPNLDPAPLARQMSRRFKFLRDKLIEDLQLGEKIFVYKRKDGVVPDAELRELCVALRSYGPNTLLYVRRPESPNHDATIIDAGNGLLIGYITDLASDGQQLNRAIGGYYRKWNAICRLAWHATNSAQLSTDDRT